MDDDNELGAIFVRRDKADEDPRRQQLLRRTSPRLPLWHQPAGRWREILNTDSMHVTVATPATVAWCTAMRISHGRQHSLNPTLPPLATIWLMQGGNDAACDRRSNAAWRNV